MSSAVSFRDGGDGAAARAQALPGSRRLRPGTCATAANISGTMVVRAIPRAPAPSAHTSAQRPRALTHYICPPSLRTPYADMTSSSARWCARCPDVAGVPLTLYAGARCRKGHGPLSLLRRRPSRWREVLLRRRVSMATRGWSSSVWAVGGVQCSCEARMS